MDVEMVFRDIDANGIVLHLFRASACHSGLSPGYPFGPKEKTRADPTVARPLERSAGSRSDPRHCREGCHPLAAVPSRLSGTKSHKTSGYRTYIITTRRMTSGGHRQVNGGGGGTKRIMASACVMRRE